MNNRKQTLREFLDHLIENQKDYSAYIDIASSDRPDLRPAYDIPQYLDLRVMKVTYMFYNIIDNIFEYKLSEKIGENREQGFDELGKNKEVLNALNEFYKCTLDYAKHTTGVGNYTPVGQLLNLRSAVVNVEDTFNVAKRKELLKQKAQIIEDTVNKIMESKNTPTPTPGNK